MRLIDLVQKEAAAEQRKVLITASLAGVANAATLRAINAAAKNPDRRNLPSLIAFLGFVVIYIVCSRHTLHRGAHIFEAALKTIRLRVESKIRRAEMQRLERIGTAEIYDRMTENLSVVSDSAPLIMNFMQSMCVVAFGAIYISFVSPSALFIMSIIIVGALAMSLDKNAETRKHLSDAADTRLTVHDLITDLLKGIKEIKSNQKRNDELHEDFVDAVESLRANTVKANLLFDDEIVRGNVVLIGVLGALVYVVPQYSSASAGTLVDLISAFLFIWGPLTGLVGGRSVITRSNLALANVEKLEQKLDETLVDGNEPSDKGRLVEEIQSIEVDQIEFYYEGDEPDQVFHIGPLSLTIQPQELLFIVGGNGSGKSTLLKVLTGLYLPVMGAMRINGIPLRPANRQRYRELFSVVHSDFHLFKKLYGVRGVESAEVHRLLQKMHLDRKVSYVNGKFSTTNLSTGQRKRLALIVALLEDRPIYAFDEWAADQDPAFRRYFYEELLPELKQRGKTVLIVTHDDGYFHHADRIVTMEYGEIRSIQVNTPAPLEKPSVNPPIAQHHDRYHD